MSDIKAPRRRFTVAIEIGADDWASVKRALREIVMDAEMHENDHRLETVSGGYDHGYWAKTTEDPTMTNERYALQLATYLAVQAKGEKS